MKIAPPTKENITIPNNVYQKINYVSHPETVNSPPDIWATVITNTDPSANPKGATGSILSIKLVEINIEKNARLNIVYHLNPVSCGGNNFDLKLIMSAPIKPPMKVQLIDPIVRQHQFIKSVCQGVKY